MASISGGATPTPFNSKLKNIPSCLKKAGWFKHNSLTLNSMSYSNLHHQPPFLSMNLSIESAPLESHEAPLAILSSAQSGCKLE